MIVKTYSGRTVAEALGKVRTALGDDALIIETRPVREPGLLGRRSGYEVVAASAPATVDAPAPAAAEPGVRAWEPVEFGATPATAAANSGIASGQAKALARETGRYTRTARTASPAALSAANAGVEDELAGIRAQLARLAQSQGAATPHLGAELRARCEDQELPPELVAELDAALEKAGERLDPARRGEFLVRLLARQLPCAGAIDWTACRRLMMVGPTGVGKTTTLAKLAGDLVLKQRRSVALVTIDTYRVGATDQLRAYADLLDVPLEVATSPAQLGAILRRFEHVDNVLIDTAGRSPADSARVQELKGFARAAPGVAVMLAAAATSGRAEFAAVVERFSVLPLAHTVITKLDECAAAGRLYGCLRRHRLPLNYVTAGQEVPEDIAPAVAATVPELLFPAAVAVA
jgi:flagellar biosynthesis protein FlhF